LRSGVDIKTKISMRETSA